MPEGNMYNNINGNDVNGGNASGNNMRGSKPGDNKMATMALLMGVGSMFLLLTGMSSIAGGLGIIFALLSRDHVMSAKAKAGLILSIVSTVAFIMMMVIAYYLLVSTGTLQQIMNDISNIDPNSLNAYSDIMNILEKNIMNMYQIILNGAGNVPGITA